MTILSDTAIKERIRNDGLIANGDPDAGRQCSYRFTASKIYHGGSEGLVVDFEDDDHDLIQPGEFVWVRMKELVKLPNDLCAFWWQTNKLSRKGLLLMNMSVVEPGYEGPLSCLFINFSKEPVLVTPGMALTKLVFLKMDQATTRSAGKVGTTPEAIRRYDASVHVDAIQRPSRFFRMQELIDGLQGDFNQFVDSKKQEFRRDIPKAIRASSIWAGGALAILLLISTVSPWVQKQFAPPQPRIAEAVREELRNWVVLPPMADHRTTDSLRAASQERAALKRELAELQGRLDDVKQKLETIDSQDDR